MDRSAAQSSQGSPTTHRTHPLISLLVILTICFAVAFVGTQGSMVGLRGWYMTLSKPSWTPPSWVFAPVWTVLYLMMGIAAWMVWRTDGDRRLPLTLFGVQLLLNGLWSWIFFAWQRPNLAFYEIVVLWVAIAATLVVFWRVRAAAGALLIPYLLWVTFASVLSFAIWRMNR